MRITNMGLLVVLAVILIYAGCTTPGKGKAIRADAGANIDNGSGEAGKSALIDPADEAVVGSSSGKMLDKQAAELKKVVDARRAGKNILVILKSDILFDSGKDTLKPEAVELLGKVGDILAKYPKDRIVVAGHTDNIGTEKFNQTLSEKRAKAVKVELMGHDVPGECIRTIGMGYSQPDVSNETAAGRAKNRRIILKISIPKAIN